MSDLQPEKQSIERLTERYTALSTKKIQAQTNLDNAEKELKKLKKQAKEEYGTDDLEQLKEKLNEMETENERKRSEYQQLLDTIEGELAKVEDQYADEGSQEPE
jgi:hypothetical protein